MIEWKTIALILCLLLLVFLIWKEWNRQSKQFLVARLIATLIAMTSLYLLAVPPVFSRKIEQTENSLILLADGFVRDSLRNLLRAGEMPVYDLSKIGIDEILRTHKGVNTVHLFGYGLEEHDLKKLSGQSLIFHPSEMPTGFTSIYYKRQLTQGEPLEVSGKFQHLDSGRITVQLTSFGTILDSARTDKNNIFLLKHLPQHIGRASYSLIALAGKDTLEKQIIPLQVSEHNPLKVLFLSSAPGFESRFLKDWLSKKGYQVISKTRVSKNAYSKEFVNEQKSNLDRINPALLEKLDCIVADNGALQALPGTELSAINKAIREKGLGLLIFLDGEEPRSGTRLKFQMSRLSSGMQQNLDLKINDGTALKTLNTENQFALTVPESMQPLVRDHSNKTYSATALDGRGHIVLTTINYSYKWILAGASKDYDMFWQTLISKTLGGVSTENWQTKPEWPVVDQPTTIIVETELKEPVGLISGQQVYLKENPQFPGRWDGKFWPGTAGWQSINKTDGSISWFYVYDKTEWKTLKRSRLMKDTRDFIFVQNNKPETETKEEMMEKRQVPSIIFLLLFMISVGFLWYEQKRMSG
jgi:hypothetical protein